MVRQLREAYPGSLSHLTARRNDQQTIAHDETNREDFLTRLGQKILPERWCGAKSSNDPCRVYYPSWVCSVSAFVNFLARISKYSSLDNPRCAEPFAFARQDAADLSQYVVPGTIFLGPAVQK